MIYELKSKATGNLIMTEAVGDMVLRAAGKTPAPQGIITVEQMPGALAQLKAAIALAKQHDAQEKPRQVDVPGDAQDEQAPPPIGLATRALPFVEMLERAHAGGKDITWGA
jgi:Domain of unknown function (DUF1840)